MAATVSIQQFDASAVFQEELAKAVQVEAERSGFPVEEWFWAGPRNGQRSIEWWQEKGPEYVQNFIDWWEHNPDVSIWTTPDGIPAIELPFQVMFGEIEVRGYIDLVLKIGTALVVVDLKSSAKAPTSNRQLGIYASAMELKYGIRPRYGTWFMVRGVGPKGKPPTFFLRPVELDRPQYSVAYLAAEFASAERGIQAGAFPAKPGDNCGRCGVAWACTEVNGDQAYELDPHYPGGKNAARA
jgi:putative RecB family exonuclease